MSTVWRGSLAAAVLGTSALVVLPVQRDHAQVSVAISVNIPPPELPVYDQPPLPGDGYLWAPGYWAWDADYQDYYWVPGTWVPAPQPDYLWTPGYWAVAGALFIWHAGYWGPQVGFYGGIDYGHGYGGHGYQGGYWRGGRLFYNQAVVNVGNTHVTNVYNQTVITNVTVNRVSYNGGNGVRATPTAGERAAAHAPHLQATALQRQHTLQARNDPAQRFGHNQGRPSVVATARPGVAPHSGGADGAQSRPRSHPPGPGMTTQAPGQHPAHENSPSREAAPHEALPRATAPREGAPREAAPHEVAPREALPHLAPSRDAGPRAAGEGRQPPRAPEPRESQPEHREPHEPHDPH